MFVGSSEQERPLYAHWVSEAQVFGTMGMRSTVLNRNAVCARGNSSNDASIDLINSLSIVVLPMKACPFCSSTVIPTGRLM